MDYNNDVVEIDLYELFRVYIENLKYIALAFLIGAVIMAGISVGLMKPTYEATAKMYVVSSSGSAYIDLSDLNMGESLASDYETLMYGKPVLQKTIDNLKLDMTTEELASMITIANPSDTRILEITVTGKMPAQVSLIANELMDVAIEYLPETMDTVPPNVAEEAPKAGTQVGPEYVKNTLLGAIAGLILAMLYFTVAYIRDDSVKSEEDIERLFGLTVLASIPDDEYFKPEGRNA